jgi:Sulfotransferase family
VNVYQRVRTSLGLRLGRRFVQIRQAIRPIHQAAPAPAPERDRVPIILVGCHRSGTSLVRRILDSHSRLACPPETLLFEPLGRVLSHDLAERGFAAMGLTVDQAALELGATVDRWMTAYAGRKGKVRWAEKSPSTALQLPAVDAMFGHAAQFVWVVRDGMDVATSLGNGRWSLLDEHIARHGDPHLAAAHYWVDMNHKIAEFQARNPQRTHTLSYEALIEDPERELRGLFAFLGEPWEPAVLDFNRLPHDAGIEDHTVSATWKFEDGRGKHRSLPEDLQREMWEVLGPTALALGYPPRFPLEPARLAQGRS